MKQKCYNLFFSVAISLLFVLPLGYRFLIAILPESNSPVNVEPVPDIYFENIANRDGIKCKVKGLYMDIQINMNNYDAWYKTGFTFRDTMLSLYGAIKTDALHSQPFPDKVLFGKGDWLFTGDRFDNSLSEQLGINCMAEQDISELADAILGLQNWCDERGILYVFLPTWGKAGIYRDSIPLVKSDEPTTLEQLIRVLNTQGVRLVDFCSQLEKQPGKTLFFRHDSHWNGHGAWIAYQQLMNTLQAHLPDLKALSERDVFADTIFPGDMDLTKLLGMQSSYPSIYVSPKKRQAQRIKNRLSVPDRYTYVSPDNYEFRYKNDSGRHKALVFRDSYFVHLEPLFLEGFYETVLVWHRIPDTTLIKKEKPDVVIQQISERLINDMYYEMKRLENQK